METLSDRRMLMRSLALKVLIGAGVAALIAGLGVMIWAGFVFSKYG